MPHTLPWTFEELGKGENKSLEVEFECHTTNGHPGTYWDPPEPAEVEFADVTIIAMLGDKGDIEISPSWHEALKEIALELAENNCKELEESLWERISDDDDAALEDHYDRKRDEARGG